MNIIDQILNSPLLLENPPVLLDVGASGKIHDKWQAIAKYSICIAFDADDRDLGYAVNETTGFKKLYVFNSLVASGIMTEANFYLTRSPHCSSLLEPDVASLDKYNFGDLFVVDRTVRLKTVQLADSLREIGVSKIDWFKTDSQGTDLRLFAGLGEDVYKKTIFAEFEPGIIDGYKGEDKLCDVMSFMDRNAFWMNDVKYCGAQRISKNTIDHIFTGYNGEVVGGLNFRESPCWAEVSYFNSFDKNGSYLEQRDFLLGWLFAFIEGQHGFCLDLAVLGKQHYGEAVFDLLGKYSLDLILTNS